MPAAGFVYAKWHILYARFAKLQVASVSITDWLLYPGAMQENLYCNMPHISLFLQKKYFSLQPQRLHSSMDRISDSGSDDMGSTPVGATLKRQQMPLAFFLWVYCTGL
jgi:hypothetical protein